MEQNFFKFDPKIEKAADVALGLCQPAFAKIEETAQYNSMKVLAAFT